MRRKWFVHGHWPIAFVRTHWFALAAFSLLLITGLLLFLPQVHTVLIPVLPILYDLHITFGILLGFALLLPLFVKLPQGKKVRRLDWVLTQVLIAAITMSGVVLWLITFFPATWRAFAFTLHGDFSYVYGGWIVIHLLMRAFSIGKEGKSQQGKPSRWISRRVSWERRQFVKWSAFGVGGLLVWLLFGSETFGAFSPRESALSGKLPADLPNAIPPFPEYYTVTGRFPDIAPSAYRLTIDGLVGVPRSLTLVELKKVASHKILRNFQCVTGWVVPNIVWTGVPLRALAELAKVKNNAKYITFYSADGVYTDSLTLEQAYHSDVLLAYAINGQPLPQRQGFPVRLIVPEMYGYKSIKWVQRISFVEERQMGYWERNGYPADAYIGGQA